MLLPNCCLRKRIGFCRNSPGTLEEQLKESQDQEHFLNSKSHPYLCGVLGKQRISPIFGERQFVEVILKAL